VRKPIIVGFPMFTLAKYSGMGESPPALRRAGIGGVFRHRPKDLGDVDVPELERDTGPETLKNFGEFLAGTERIYRAMRNVNEEEMIVALGGECSLAVGELAGLKEANRGKPGVLWMDSHGDFNTPETTPSGYIGGMCLALACGRGPRLTPGLDDLMPLIDEERLIHFGSRALDAPEVEAMRSSPMELLPVKEIRTNGIERTARGVAKRLSDRADWIICHFDADVVDPSVIPSVNYPTADGLSLDEVTKVMGALERTGKLAAVNLAAYNARLDVSGNSAKALVRAFSRVFG
jgi:arginase